LPVRGEVVGTLDVDRVDRRDLGELHEVDDAGRLRTDLGQVLFVHDDVASLLELVALDHFRQRHLALALRAPALLLDARLALAVELVEADGGGRIGGREDPDRDVHQADLEETFPGRTCCHGGIIDWKRARGWWPGQGPPAAALPGPIPRPPSPLRGYGETISSPLRTGSGLEIGTSAAGRCSPGWAARWLACRQPRSGRTSGSPPPCRHQSSGRGRGCSRGGTGCSLPSAAGWSARPS